MLNQNKSTYLEADTLSIDTFAALPSDDLYLQSHLYLLMTGRRGFEIYNGYMVCAHPNNHGQYLIIPKLYDKLTADRIAEYLSMHAQSEVTIGRIPQDKVAPFAAQLMREANNAKLSIVAEPYLDWAYPVYTLDTKLVSEMKGQNFKDFRKNIHRATRQPLSVKKFTITDVTQLKKLAQKWATRLEKDENKVFELYEPYLWISNAIAAKQIFVEGVIVYSNQEEIGIVLWEKSNQSAVSSIMSLSLPGHKGCSEYLYWLMCDNLRKNGVEQVCIGGSETGSLDFFKRKMNPIKALPLQSITVQPTLGAKFFDTNAVNQNIA